MFLNADTIILIVCRLIVVMLLIMAACQLTRASSSADEYANSGGSAVCHRKSWLNWLICTAIMWAVSSEGSEMSA